MCAKKFGIIATALALVIGGAACKRNEVEQPSPLGPSTLATVLKVSANPNVINAGSVRAGTTISASLMKYDGTPLTNRTITFEICDDAHNRVPVGFFEGQQAVVSRQTDGGGNVSLTYIGPLNNDITTSGSINIWATAAAEGDEYIENFTPITIIRDGSSSTAVLLVSADPNVILAGARRQATTVTANLLQLDGTPLANRAVYFEVCDAAHSQVDIGFFEGSGGVLTKRTDGRGVVTATYYGPLSSEIAANTSVSIFATAAGEGEESIQGSAPVTIIRDDSSTVVALDIVAEPNILNAGTARESALITATVKRPDGTPLANRTVYFEINDDSDHRSNIGHFKEENPVASVVTNSSGRASVTYYGPVKSEIGASRVMHIWASTPGEGDPFIKAYVEIFIIR